MKTTVMRVVLILVLGILVASVPAQAAKYVVKLKNGTEFRTLYIPKEASWDRNYLLLMTSAGNWVPVAKDDVEKIISVLQQQGFGKILDEKTVEIGFTTNDAPTEEELKAMQENRTDLDRYLDVLRATAPPPPQDFTVNQFVSPSQAGQSGGVPAEYSRY